MVSIKLNLAQYVYEMIVLAVPHKRIHPGVLDGSLDSEALKKLEELQPKERKDNTRRYRSPMGCFKKVNNG